MSDRLAVLPQYLLPKGALTNFAGRVAGAKGGAMTTRLIRWFVGKYNVNMAATILTALVPLAIYFVSGRLFVRGIAAGAVKG